jgi:DNA-binding NarL/FixJ family response regulator
MNMYELITIGIVDDHNLYKRGLKLALSFYDDLNILFDAENGLDLLNKLESREPDVILLDLQMSGMDGITVLPHLKKQYPHIKVIILSIYNDLTIVEKLTSLGADSYLSKSSEVEQMYHEIRQVVSNDVQLHC